MIMAFDKEKLITELKTVATGLTLDDTAGRGYHLALRVESDRITDCAGILLGYGFYLVFVTAVHVQPAIEVVYQFAHYDAPCRVIIRLSAGAEKRVPSIASVYQGAAWHEREIYDFFGILFPDHPNLKPLILTREDKGMNPLLKDEKKLRQGEELFSRI
jgi:NADH-quinone oxidoreductase subunit C